ncbi:MAG: F0F1 ATP synthase subunit gamma [Anaerovoracaceae bacterium]|jgi:F-type H+-transporting ATPase subunit gamma|nr:F0F1 ATP synthase subunit gamma [Anaerovoracaceae bacterium]
MEGLQEIKKNINSTVNLKAIVNTMKAHASSNINQFQNAARASMEYRNVLDMSLFVVLSEEEELLPLDEVKKGTRLHIVFGSDHGLAGRFNERITSFALERISNSENDKVIIIGQQVFQRLRGDLDIYKTFMQPQSTDNISSMVNELLVKIDELRDQTPIEKIVLYYNKPYDNATFAEETELLFPIDLFELAKKKVHWNSKSVPTYFADRQIIISDLIRQYLFITLYRAFCFSLASENASRLASMQSAEKNIDTRLEELNFLFRRERQNSITEELNDIVSGFKAIRNAKNEEEDDDNL